MKFFGTAIAETAVQNQQKELGLLMKVVQCNQNITSILIFIDISSQSQNKNKRHVWILN